MELEINPVYKDENSNLKTYKFRRDEFYNGYFKYSRIARNFFTFLKQSLSCPMNFWIHI